MEVSTEHSMKSTTKAQGDKACAPQKKFAASSHLVLNRQDDQCRKRSLSNLHVNDAQGGTTSFLLHKNATGCHTWLGLSGCFLCFF
jgi:hypothetical protein